MISLLFSRPFGKEPGPPQLQSFALVTLLAAAAIATDVAGAGELGDLELVVSASVSAQSDDADVTAVAERMADTAVGLDINGLLLSASGAEPSLEATVQSIRDAVPRVGEEVWVATTFDRSAVTAFSRSVARLPVTGVALMFASSEAEPLESADLAALLERKEAGDRMGEAIRELKAGLGEDQRLALCLPLTEMLPETSRRQYVPLADLVQDGTVDVVCLSGQETFNLHRLRLLRDTPLKAGVLVDAAAVAEGSWGQLIARRTLGAIKNPSCDCLWLAGFPPDMAVQRASDAVTGYRRALERRRELEAAIDGGQLIVDREFADKDAHDQASVHGVAQCFTPSRDGRCPLLQVYVALRGCSGPLPPPLEVQIRPDAGGEPGDEVLGTAKISPLELGHEPEYRWATATFAEPVSLNQGTSYWIYMPPANHDEGTYVWRIGKESGTAASHAWSRRYDYATDTWLFRAYLEKEATQ